MGRPRAIMSWSSVALLLCVFTAAAADMSCSSYTAPDTCNAATGCIWGHWGCMAASSRDMRCGADAQKTQKGLFLSVSQTFAPAIKFRSCNHTAKPDVPAGQQPSGYGCNGHTYVDCLAMNITDHPERLPHGLGATVSFDSKVQSLMIVTYDDVGAYNVSSYCYMTKPQAGWPAAPIHMDRKWWQTLQMSCVHH